VAWNGQARDASTFASRLPLRKAQHLEMNMKKTLIAVAAVSVLAACTTTSPDVVQRGDAQRLATVQDATVLSVRNVTVDGSQSGAGGATGAVLGGVAGSTRSSGRESAAIAVVGAVAGAVVGNAIERASTKEDAVEILLQMKNGERRAIVQAKASETFNPGDAVILVTTGGKTRVQRAPAGTQPVQPLPAPVPGTPPKG
jgi:outer membrane lipoprotein SlyB